MLVQCEPLAIMPVVSILELLVELCNWQDQCRWWCTQQSFGFVVLMDVNCVEPQL